MAKTCARVNNYKTTHRYSQKEQRLSNQKRFPEYYLQGDHNGICDWEITIIDQDKTERSSRQKKLHWWAQIKNIFSFWSS